MERLYKNGVNALSGLSSFTRSINIKKIKEERWCQRPKRALFIYTTNLDKAQDFQDEVCQRPKRALFIYTFQLLHQQFLSLLVSTP